MASTECKRLLPYLQRAQEMQQHDPVVSYYCRLHALEVGMRLPSRGEELRGLMGAVMKQLEADKAAGRGPGASREDDQLHVEGFAQQIFSKADKVDRAGCATIKTARSFYAAAVFFEVLGVFGEVEEDVQTMQKYAAWKAADIQRAIREGRKPAAGPPEAGDGAPPGAGEDAAPGRRSQADAIFAPGQRVLCSSSSSGIEQGVVRGQEAARTFLVGLADGEHPAVAAASLAPFFEPGEALMYHRGGEFHAATLVKMDVSHWPPSYTVQFNGSEVDTEGFNLASPTLVQGGAAPELPSPPAAPEAGTEAAGAPGEPPPTAPPAPPPTAPPDPIVPPVVAAAPPAPQVPSYDAPAAYPEAPPQGPSGFAPTNVRAVHRRSESAGEWGRAKRSRLRD